MEHRRRFTFPEPPPWEEPDTRSLGDLFRELSADASRLVRQEITLARAEMRRNARTLARDLASTAIWGVVAAVGGLVLVAFLVTFLGDLLDNYWLAALVVGLLFMAVGGGLAYRALQRMQARQVQPRETMESLRETRDWAQAEASQVRSALAGAEHGDGGGVVNGRGSGVAGVAPPPTVRRVSPAREHATRAEGEAGPPRERGGAGAPAQGVAKRVWHEFSADDISGQAAKVAYYFFLSLPPALMAIFALTGIFGGPALADRITAELTATVPGEASGLVEEFVNQVVREQKPGVLSIGILLALWSASNVFTALGDTLNVAYDTRPTRSWVKKKLVAVGVLLAVAVLFLAGSLALLAGPAIAGAVGLGGVAAMLWNVLQWPLAFLLIASAFWVVYYVLPERDQSEFKGTLFKAASIAAGLWLLATLGFRLYITNFSSYSETYGFIGAVIVLLLWMYLTSLVVLLGGEIASEMEEGR